MFGFSRGFSANALRRVGRAPALKKYPNFPQTTLMDPNVAYTTSGGGTFGLVDDPSFRDSRKVLQVVANNSNCFVKSPLFSSPVDVRNGHLTWWLKMPSFVANDIDPNGGISIRLYSSGTPGGAEPANYHKWGNRVGIQQNFSAGPFVKVGAHPNDFTAVGTGADLSAITWVAVLYRAYNAGTPVTFLMSKVHFTPNPRTKAAVIFRQDDAWKRAGLRDLFASYGVPWFLAPGAVAGSNGFNGAGYNTPPTNNPDRWSIAEVNAMRAAGVQCGTQAWSTENTQADLAAYRVEMQGMQQYYQDRGWVADAADGTWYSNVNLGTAGARQAMLENGSRTIQRFTNGRNNVVPGMETGETFPFRDETSITTINLAAPGIGTGAPAITDSITNELNRTIAMKGVLTISGHQDMYDQAPELAAIQYVLTRWQSGGGTEFDILTLNQLLDPYLAQYGGRDYAAPNY